MSDSPTTSGLQLTATEIQTAFSAPEWAQRFPPVLSVDQVAELLQIPVATVYQHSSRGLYSRCAMRVGKHLRFIRDRLMAKVFNEGLQPKGINNETLRRGK